MDKKDDDIDLNRYWGMVGAPLLLIVAPVCGYFFGDWLDSLFNTAPYLMYTFLFIGVLAGIREFYKLVKELINDDRSNH